MEKAPDDNKGPKGKGKRRQKKWNTSNTERNLPCTSKDSKSPDETVDTKTQNFGENVRENVGNKEVFKQKQNSKATKAPPTIKQEEATQQKPENAPSTAKFTQNPKKKQNKNQPIKQEEATQQNPENAPSTATFRQNPQKTKNKNQPIKQEEATQQNPENAPSTSQFRQNPQKPKNKNQPIKQEEAAQQNPENAPSTSQFRQNPKKTQNKNQDSESSYSRQSSQNAGKYNPPSRTSVEEPPIQSQLAIKSSTTIDRETSIPKQISTIERGTAGQVFQVETNYLNINLDKMPKVAFHYDITIEPGRPKKFLRQVFEKFNSQFFKDIAMAFDSNKNVYTVQKLPVNQFEAEVDILDSNMKSMKYRVAIKETENLCIDLDSLRTYSKTRIYDKPMRALQCLDVVLSNPCHSKGIRVGRSFFTKPDQVYNLSDGYEMWTGLFQAAILGDVPFLNVDISNKSFYTESRIIDFLGDKIGRNNLRQKLAGRDLFSFRSYVKGVNVLYEPPRTFGVTPKMYKVFDVTEQSASQLTFIAEDQKKLTVADYFKSRGYNLLFPELNCLQVGSSIRKVYLPLELCKINGGQAPNKKDGTAQVQRMIKFAATSTDVRKSKIERALRYFLHNNDSVVHKFGIRIDSAFCKVPLRLLSPPSIIYKSDVITPARGAWRLNERTQFLRTNNVQYPQKWALIYHQGSKRRLNDFREFVSMFSKKAKQMNILLDDKPPLIEYFMIDEALRDLKRKKFDLVLAVLPNFSVSYADIKKSAELHHGILTQCIKENTIVQRLDSTLILNLLLKVNAKLNGTNHNYKDVDLKNSSLTNVMFLGADVTHPSPDQSYIPSVVGVAASHDAYGACYNMQYRLQRSSAEVIEDMESIVRYHLEFYKKAQNAYPENIIYYRDGVSDGQFPLIKNVELKGIRAACAKVKAKPKITCVVVVKRHHTRFFPQFKGNDKFNNVPPGSVVDRVIVHPNEVQFFMVSHVSVQGTARPTRYNVIEDDAKINIDVLQKLTYNMCHMFPRCNRSVSYPAPAYLAHLAAFRGRVYLEGSRRFDAPKKEYEKRTISPELLVSNPMYFV